MTEASRDDFFRQTAERRIVPIRGLEAWGIQAYMRSMTAGEKTDFEASVLADDLTTVDDDRLRSAKARLVIFGVCNAKGHPLFESADLERVRHLDSKCIEIIHNQISAHVGFDRGDLERLVKNSEAVRAACSPTNSPCSSDG